MYDWENGAHWLASKQSAGLPGTLVSDRPNYRPGGQHRADYRFHTQGLSIAIGNPIDSAARGS